MYSLGIEGNFATQSPNVSELERNYVQNDFEKGSLSYRDSQLSPEEKIQLIYKEFGESLAASESEEEFIMPSDQAVSEAKVLIPQLFMFKEPLVSFLSDGSIVFQWMNRPDSVLTFSVSGEETVVFACSLNRTTAVKKLSGTIPFCSRVLPKEIRNILNDHFLDENVDEKYQWIESLQTQSN